jgi:hypothetical protein
MILEIIPTFGNRDLIMDVDSFGKYLNLRRFLSMSKNSILTEDAGWRSHNVNSNAQGHVRDQRGVRGQASVTAVLNLRVLLPKS